MPKFEVTGWEKVTRTTVIEADSEEEAIELAEEALEEVDPVSQGYDAWIANEVEEEDSDTYENECVTRSAPRWAWDIIDQTLEMDSHSKAFSEELRQQITHATSAMAHACETGADHVSREEDV